MDNISACIITDFNIKLNDCIKSIIDYVDEIIIVNTYGKELIFLDYHEPKIKLYDFKWCDDFSEARNYSLSKATGNIILCIDSDETLKTPLINFSKEFDIWNVRVSNNNSYHWVYKIFRNYKGIKFGNKIHETIQKSIKGLKIANTMIKYEHTGYEEGIKEKQERNFRILLKDYDNPERDFELGRCYLYKGEYEKALDYFRLIANDGSNNYKSYILNFIHTCENKLEYPAEMQLKTLRESLELTPVQIYARANIFILNRDYNLIPEMKRIRDNKLSQIPNDIYLPDEYFEMVETERIPNQWQSC